MPGSGKTSLLIKEMQKENNYSYMYITPFLKEVERVKKECNNRKFYEPDAQKGKGKKLNDMHNLLMNEKNIVSTHALFKNSNELTRELIKAGNYILVLDEVMDVIEQVQLNKDDLKLLLDKEMIKVENNMIIWNDNTEYDDTKYNDIKEMAKNNTLFMVNNIVLIWTFPINIFECFKEVYILTYMFDGQIQKYYFDLYNIEYEYYHVEKQNNEYLKIDGKIKEEKNFKINIIENDKINNIGDDRYTLSVSWFMKNRDTSLMDKMKNNLLNWFKNKNKANSNEIIWTTFKTYKSKLQGKGYTKGFLSVNARATNEYRNRMYLAYCANIFLNPLVKLFFTQNGIKVNEDVYALSEMLQWIFRSAIRDGKEIWIYIPSSRQRQLLIDWLED